MNTDEQIGSLRCGKMHCEGLGISVKRLLVDIMFSPRKCPNLLMKDVILCFRDFHRNC